MQPGKIKLCWETGPSQEERPLPKAVHAEGVGDEGQRQRWQCGVAASTQVTLP